MDTLQAPQLAVRVADFYAFMREREAIRLRRLEGAPPPWTEDPILREFSFTNIKREHDKTSRLLIEEFPPRSRLNRAIAVWA